MKTTRSSQLNRNTRPGHRTNIGQAALRLNNVSLLVLLLAAFVVVAPRAWASDPVGIFALVDKVVLEPNATAPERIQIWGAFALADRKGSDSYAAPKQGCLYYKLPADKADVAKKEWADLKSIAGQREVIGFGSRYGEKGTIRKQTDKPEKPDEYPLGWGLVKMKDRKAEYGPIKELLALAPAKAAEKK